MIVATNEVKATSPDLCSYIDSYQFIKKDIQEIYILINLSKVNFTNFTDIKLNYEFELDRSGFNVDVYYCPDVYDYTSLTWNNKDTVVPNCEATPFYTAAVSQGSSQVPLTTKVMNEGDSSFVLVFKGDTLNEWNRLLPPSFKITGDYNEYIAPEPSEDDTTDAVVDYYAVYGNDGEKQSFEYDIDCMANEGVGIYDGYPACSGRSSITNPDVLRNLNTAYDKVDIFSNINDKIDQLKEKLPAFPKIPSFPKLDDLLDRLRSLF